jgi:ribose transport system substrate-binding protein
MHTPIQIFTLITCLAASVLAEDARKPVIALVPKGASHVFWKTVEAGAKQAGGELGVEIVWSAPQKEDDRAQQMAMVDTLILRKVDALCLAPLDAVALRDKAVKATEAGIPVIIFDSPLAKAEGASAGYVGTDNYAAGKKAGEGLAAQLGGKGRVIMLRYQVGSASTDAREEGFLAGIKTSPGIEVVSSNQYAGATTASAIEKSKSLLLRFSGERAPDGIFCCNQSTTIGMLQALQQNGLAGKIRFVGFDPTIALVDALRKGEITGIIAQDPFSMGRKSVEAAVAKIRGQSILDKTDTGSVLVTKDNVDTSAVQAVIKPQMN